jgi:hypothetical protein
MMEAATTVATAAREKAPVTIIRRLPLMMEVVITVAMVALKRGLVIMMMRPPLTMALANI